LEWIAGNAIVNKRKKGQAAHIGDSITESAMRKQVVSRDSTRYFKKIGQEIFITEKGGRGEGGCGTKLKGNLCGHHLG